jgi:predicted RNA-binding protein with TRAM domain
MSTTTTEDETETDRLQTEIEALRGEVDELRDDLDALRGLFSDRVLKTEDAHVDAQKRDASEVVEVGETHTVVIDGTEYNDPRNPSAVAHIDGLVTFVPAPDEDLAEGDKIQIRIADTGDSHANAVRVEG